MDTTAPDPPGITTPANDSRDRSFNVRGTTEPGSMVRLYEDVTRLGTSETDPDPDTGVWNVAVVDGSEGPHAYTG